MTLSSSATPYNPPSWSSPGPTSLYDCFTLQILIPENWHILAPNPSNWSECNTCVMYHVLHRVINTRPTPGGARVRIVYVAVCWLLYTIVQYVWWPLRKYSPSPCSCISDSRLLLFRRHRDCGVSAPWCSGNVGGVRAGGNGALTPPRPGNGCSAASGPRGQVTNTRQQPHGETGETARHQRRTLHLIEPRRLSSSHYQRPCKCLGQKGCRKCGGGEQ